MKKQVIGTELGLKEREHQENKTHPKERGVFCFSLRITKCIETWVARIGDPRHTRESEYVMGRIRDRIHICSSISSFKASHNTSIISTKSGNHE